MKSVRRFGQMINLKPEGAESYTKYHREAWPDVLKMIRKCNIENYSIFRRGLSLFAYFEYVGDNFEADMATMAADPTTQRWWDTVKPLMEPLDDRAPDEFWSDMEEIFHLD